jgi:hypothetical protein
LSDRKRFLVGAEQALGDELAFLVQALHRGLEFAEMPLHYSHESFGKALPFLGLPKTRLQPRKVSIDLARRIAPKGAPETSQGILPPHGTCDVLE